MEEKEQFRLMSSRSKPAGQLPSRSRTARLRGLLSEWRIGIRQKLSFDEKKARPHPGTGAQPLPRANGERSLLCEGRDGSLTAYMRLLARQAMDIKIPKTTRAEAYENGKRYFLHGGTAQLLLRDLPCAVARRAIGARSWRLARNLNAMRSIALMERNGHRQPRFTTATARSARAAHPQARIAISNYYLSMSAMLPISGPGARP